MKTIDITNLEGMAVDSVVGGAFNWCGEVKWSPPYLTFIGDEISLRQAAQMINAKIVYGDVVLGLKGFSATKIREGDWGFDGYTTSTYPKIEIEFAPLEK